MNRRCGWLLFFVLLCLGTRLQAQNKSPLRFPESRSYSPRKIWLEWNRAERTGFVRGFIVGHGDGYREGCMSLESSGHDLDAKTGLDPCLEKRHLFRKNVASYEKFVTDFYNQYSEDRDVPLRILLLQADERTPREIHQWLAKKD
jgi:hypothetical protein